MWKPSWLTRSFVGRALNTYRAYAYQVINKHTLRRTCTVCVFPHRMCKLTKCRLSYLARNSLYLGHPILKAQTWLQTSQIGFHICVFGEVGGQEMRKPSWLTRSFGGRALNTYQAYADQVINSTHRGTHVQCVFSHTECAN